MEATRIGVDLAKNFFHLVAMDARGKVVWRKALTRRRLLEFLTQLPPCRIGMEACATAHYWGREMQKLGHEVKLIHPSFAAAYRKSGKNDFNDAEAIGEAMSRPMMRFVELKSIAQQDMQSLHRTRQLVVKQRTQVAHQLRGLLAEYGIAVRRSIPALRREATELAGEPERLTGTMRQVVANNLEQLGLLERQLGELDRALVSACRADERCRRAAEVHGVGPLTATAMVAKVGNAQQFPSGRALSAYLGLVPRQNSTGGKTVLLSISKKGDRYLRRLLIHGARAALRVAARHQDRRSQWALGLMRKSGPNVAAVALANKNARVLWKLLTSGQHFRTQPAPSQAERAPAAQRWASEKHAGRRAAARLEHERRIPEQDFSTSPQTAITRAGGKIHSTI
jgi:transposase